MYWEDGGVSDPYHLHRFVVAQDARDTYLGAVHELRQGRKQSHWMWFVFPQMVGLGKSATARRFAVSGLPEAQAYLAHPVLGPRLLECARILIAVSETNPVEVFGTIDAQKLQSSMTLFAQAAPNEPVFGQVLVQYFAGALDENTIRLL